MSTKPLVTQTFQALSAGGDLAALDELVAPQSLDHEARADRPDGPDGLRAIARSLRSGFPDLRYVIVDLIAEGDRVAARVFVQGTHAGEFRGIPATGRAVSIQQIHIWRVAAGRLEEHWACRDDLAALRQLGVLAHQK
jgi:steroid delta-isomerase-like uncharacterized protein